MFCFSVPISVSKSELLGNSDFEAFSSHEHVHTGVSLRTTRQKMCIHFVRAVSALVLFFLVPLFSAPPNKFQNVYTVPVILQLKQSCHSARTMLIVKFTGDNATAYLQL